MQFSFRKLLTISILLFAGLAFLASNQVVTRDSRIHGPLIKNKNGQSTNWSGYAVYNSGLATDVKGSWVVPTLDCSNGQSAYSSAWVGIDGYNTSSVEQTGTEHDCSGGSSSYYAWYEMYPKPGYILPISIKAGDVMSAEVRYQNGKFILTLRDQTNGQSYSLSQKSGKAQLGSAEWIMEAPWSGGVLPLADFKTANYSGGNASVGGKTGSIGSFGTIDRIDMVNNSGSLKDQTSSLGSGGDNFSVTWISSN